MINKGNNVPDKTIAIFPQGTYEHPGWYDEFSQVFTKPSKKRDWFDANFYNCRPLTIGNQQGFLASAEFDFTMIWNGGIGQRDVNITPIGVDSRSLNPTIGTNFGHGVVSFSYPFSFRTAPGVNLLTIPPPNYVIDNVTFLMGSVETDNLRHTFTFNLRINKPNEIVYIKKGTPIGAFIPIPRYFADGFELVMGENIFDEESTVEEIQTYTDADDRRRFTHQNLIEEKDRHYFKGHDIYGNKFSDWQKP